MKRTWAIVVALATVTAANASIQFFFTHSDGPYGLSGLNLDTGLPEPGFDPFLPTWGSAGSAPSDYIHGYNLKDVDGSGATDTADVPNVADLTPVTLQPGDWVWVWVRHSPDESLNSGLTGIQDLGFSIASQYDRIDFTSYFCNDLNRWQPIDLSDLTENPQSLVAVFRPGGGGAIPNRVAHFPQNLYVGGEIGTDYRHTALLSAIRCTPGDPGAIASMVTSVYSAGYLDPRTVEFLNTVSYVPEPTGVALVALLSLGLRRRSIAYVPCTEGAR